MFSRVTTALLVVVALFSAKTLFAQGSQNPAQVEFRELILPFLVTHCTKCHGAEKQAGEIRLDDLKFDNKNPERWLALVEANGAGLIDDLALSSDEQADEALLMGLRLTEGEGSTRRIRRASRWGICQRMPPGPPPGCPAFHRSSRRVKPYGPSVERRGDSVDELVLERVPGELDVGRDAERIVNEHTTDGDT